MDSSIRLWGDLCRSQAEAYGAKVAFVNIDGRETSFAAFDSRVNRLNNALSEHGLVKGDRVAILSKNRTEYVETYGLAKTGLIVVPLNWRLTAEELQFLLKHSRAKVVIADAQHAPIIDALREHLDDVRLLVQIASSRPGWTDYETLLTGADAAEPQPSEGLDPDDTVCLMYTSGTTGLPKGVAISHRGILGNARVSAEMALKLTPGDRTLAVMPLFHAGGMWYHLHASYASGCTSVLMAEFSAGAVLQQLQAQAITNTHFVPTMIGMVLEQPGVASADLRHLRLIYYAGSPIPAELLKRALRTFSNCAFVQSYGLTESGPVTALYGDDHLRAISQTDEHRLTSCGFAIGDAEIRIVDDSMNSLPHGQVGEIAIHGRYMMKGYWDNAEATSRALCNGWLRSGDIGYMDGQGYIFLKDRKNDMIVTGGENVYPSEVEDALYRDPAILQTAVFGIPDPVWMEKVVAVVILRPGMKATEKEIIGGVRKQLAAYKCPKEVFIRDQLPMNPAGKILRRDLKKQFANPL